MKWIALLPESLSGPGSFTRSTFRKQRVLFRLLCALLLLLVPAGSARAQEEVPVEDDYRVFEMEPTAVRDKKPMTAASDEAVRDKDFMTFPRQTPSDLLRVVPGIFINQHTGGGKAHQIFLRGFDAEHGQDLAGYLDGIPLNEVSQVHGQGYLDLHFLIPETLRKIKIIKGPYLPEYGDFAVAGAVDFLTHTSFPGQTLRLSYGSFNTFRGLGEIAGNFAGNDLYLVAEGDVSDGFTDPGDYWGARGLASALLPVGRHGELRILTSHYHASFDAADVVPAGYAWTQRPSVGRFGAVDDSDGGESIRHLLGLGYDWDKGARHFHVQGYYHFRKTALYTNYTYFLFHPDPNEGDQYELWEQRNYGGVRSFYSISHDLGPRVLESKVGLDTRVDQVHQKQSNAHRRTVFNTVTDYDFWETRLGAYVKETLYVNRYLQFMAGLRLDAILYDVQGTQDLNYKNICTNQADTLQDVPVAANAYQWNYSPKAAIVITPYESARGWVNTLDIYLNYGEGFEGTRASLIANLEAPDLSWYPLAGCVELPTAYPGNDHRIPKARAAEGAFRWYFWDERVSLAASLWWADKDEELVFEPESGISMPRGASRRIGQEVELRVMPLDWLYLTFDFFHTRAEFLDTQTGMSSDRIPGTPEILFQHVISVQHPSGFNAALRGRYVGPRPLPRERPLTTLTSDPYYVADLLLGYERPRWGVELGIQNLFATAWDDTSFSYPSSPEPSGTRPAGTATYEGKYVTPGIPFAVQGTVTFKF